MLNILLRVTIKQLSFNLLLITLTKDVIRPMTFLTS